MSKAERDLYLQMLVSQSHLMPDTLRYYNLTILHRYVFYGD